MRFSKCKRGCQTDSDLQKSISKESLERNLDSKKKNKTCFDSTIVAVKKVWNKYATDLAALGVLVGPKGPKALGSPKVLEGPEDLRGPDPEGLGGQEETSMISEKSRWCSSFRWSWSFGMSGTFRRLWKSRLATRISRELIKSRYSNIKELIKTSLGHIIEFS
jgi:hypothetical protein